MTDSNLPTHTAISPDVLSADALKALLEEFATRDGTDYGAVERSLEQKVDRLRQLLDTGEASIVFDSETESVTIVLAKDLHDA